MMNLKNLSVVAFCFVLMAMLFVAGCQPIAADKATLPWRSEMDVSPAALDGLDGAAAALAAAGADYLAEELDIDADAVELVGMEVVDWPDASLGCPEPDMAYAAMLTPGYIFTYEVGGETYDVHTSTDPDGRITHCEEF